MIIEVWVGAEPDTGEGVDGGDMLSQRFQRGDVREGAGTHCLCAAEPYVYFKIFLPTKNEQ